MRKLLEFVAGFILAMLFVVTACADLCSIGQCLSNDWQNAVTQENISWTDYEILSGDYSVKDAEVILCQIAIIDHMANHCSDPYFCEGTPSLGNLQNQLQDAIDAADAALSAKDAAYASWDYWHNEAIYQLGEVGHHMANCPYCD